MILTRRAVVVMALGVIPVALIPHTSTVVAWAALVALGCLVDALLAGRPRDLDARREIGRAVRLGEPATSVLTITNEGRRGVRTIVRDAWPPSAGAHDNRHRLDLPAGETRRVRTRLRPTRRGDRVADLVTIRILGPLGLSGRQRSQPAPARLRVLPEFASRKHLPSRLARLREMDGRASVQVRGQGTEFDSLREYVIGDDVRAIDWRATARRSEVVVRTWRPERDRRVLIVIDTSRLAAARLGDEPRLEAQIEAALLLAALAGKAGDRVHVVAVDSRVRARAAGDTGAALMATIADSLATVEASLVEIDWATVAQTVRDTLSHRALVAILTPLEASAVTTSLLPVIGTLTRDHQVVIASASDPENARIRAARETSEEIFDAAAAERGDLERDALALRLRQRGVDVVEAPPGELPPALADAYLALKAAGRL